MNDLHVTATSDSLKGRRIDVVVTGSIAAVESVRFIRSLRRLGAEVTPWLSQGGSTFVTATSLSWAAGRETIVGFSGHATHIATSDAVIIAPASSSTIAKMARGMTDTHCTALIASALGQKIPVLMLPAMHDSLLHAPAMSEHMNSISKWNQVHFLKSRLEEGKQKFPEPKILADEVSHLLNRPIRSTDPVLITMGTTRGYIDDVRYISNYSSGKLGTEISEELYRQGFATVIVCGPCEFHPSTYTKIISVRTTQDMLSACLDAQKSGLAAGVFCASVLDYEPSEQTTGKLKSGHSNLTVHFKPTPKIIGAIDLSGRPKVGFKLEVGLGPSQLKSISDDYRGRYHLTMLVANELSNVSSSDHSAWIFDSSQTGSLIEGKRQIAQRIGQHMIASIRS